MKCVKILMASVLALGLTVTAYAEFPETSNVDSLGSSFSYTLTRPDPSYIITIPSEIELAKDGTEVVIEASELQNLNGENVSIAIAGTNYFRDQSVLDADTSPASSMRYSITTASGEVLETTGSNPHIGKTLASFEADGKASYTVTPIITQYTQFDVAYTGTITYEAFTSFD